MSKDAFFGKVIASQKAWVKRVTGFYDKYDVNNRNAFAHFFGKA